MLSSDRETYTFGKFTLDLFAGHLRDDRGEIRLRPKSFELLRFFVANAGRLLPKDELAQSVWPDVIVGDDSLTQCISGLRKSLGDADHRIIKTVPRRGYLFTAPVSRRAPSLAALAGYADGNTTAMEARASPTLTTKDSGNYPAGASLPDKPSIAVLPFANINNDPEHEVFADGIAEDIITALSCYPSLFVIARNSCFSYKSRAADVKQIGQELGVRYVLDGGLRKSGNRIRVTAQLVEAETGKHVWAKRYDRDLADIFAVQDEIAEAVATAIAPAIDEVEQQRAMRKPPGSVDAWAAYQRGLWHLSKFTADDAASAEQLFQQAIDTDPRFSGAYVGLAMARVAIGDFTGHGPVEAGRSIETIARRAVALDGFDAEARSMLANALWISGDYEGALAEAARALEISPNLAFAHHVLGAALVFSGQPAMGIAALERSISLDPRHPRSAPRMNQMVLGLYLSGAYEAAIEVAKRTIRTYPDFANPYRWLAAALGQLGRSEEAKQALKKAMEVLPAVFLANVYNRVPWMRPEDHAHMIDGLRKAGWTG